MKTIRTQKRISGKLHQRRPRTSQDSERSRHGSGWHLARLDWLGAARRDEAGQRLALLASLGRLGAGIRKDAEMPGGALRALFHSAKLGGALPPAPIKQGTKLSRTVVPSFSSMLDPQSPGHFHTHASSLSQASRIAAASASALFSGQASPFSFSSSAPAAATSSQKSQASFLSFVVKEAKSKMQAHRIQKCKTQQPAQCPVSHQKQQ